MAFGANHMDLQQTQPMVFMARVRNLIQTVAESLMEFMASGLPLLG